MSIDENTPGSQAPAAQLSENQSAPVRTVIEAGRTERQYWHDLWRYRELTMFLAWRDVSVRYKQTVIGIAWAVIRPVLTMVIMVIVFSKVAKLDSGGVPYTLLVLSGMICWQLFSAGLSSSAESLLSSSNLISKVYFPRLVIPISSLSVALVDFLVNLPILAIMMVWYSQVPTWKILFFPAFVLLGILAALSLGLWMCALNVRYRDVRYVLPFMIQFGVYISPVGYALSAVPEAYRIWFAINPMTGIIEGFRWSLLPNSPAPGIEFLATSLAVPAILLFTGIRYFRNTERSFADVI